MNKIHFYVARERNGSLWLHLGKPIRRKNDFVNVCGAILTSTNFRKYGLNIRDYANLKWEDEPVEVFVNMKDWMLMIGDASGKDGQFSDSDKKTAENFCIDYMDVEDFINNN